MFLLGRGRGERVGWCSLEVMVDDGNEVGVDFEMGRGIGLPWIDYELT